jgi:hypothetical protein
MVRLCARRRRRALRGTDRVGARSSRVGTHAVGHPRSTRESWSARTRAREPGVLDSPDAHITPLRGSKLWQLALLEFWLQEHGI